MEKTAGNIRANNGIAIAEFCDCDVQNLSAIFISAIAMFFLRLRCDCDVLLAMCDAIAIFFQKLNKTNV